jgi:hypothetical protein
MALALDAGELRRRLEPRALTVSAAPGGTRRSCGQSVRDESGGVVIEPTGVEPRVGPSGDGRNPPRPRNETAHPSAPSILGLKVDVVYARALKASRM